MKNELNSNNTITYDNEFRWSYLLRTLGFLLFFACLFVVSLIIPTAILYLVGGWKPEFTIGDVRMLLFTSSVVFVIIVLKYFQRFRTGKYSIVGDNLIVQEKYFSNETNLTIPISHIDDVRYVPNFLDLRCYPEKGIRLLFTPFRLLEITVGNQRFKLYTFAHAEELYKELRNRITEKNK